MGAVELQQRQDAVRSRGGFDAGRAHTGGGYLDVGDLRVFPRRRRGLSAEGRAGHEIGAPDVAGPLRIRRPQDGRGRGRRLGGGDAPQAAVFRYRRRGPLRARLVAQGEENVETRASARQGAQRRVAPHGRRGNRPRRRRVSKRQSRGGGRRARRHRRRRAARARGLARAGAQVLALRQVPRAGVRRRALPRVGRALRVQARGPNRRRVRFRGRDVARETGGVQ
mmetsp:Transcript_15296/g.64538  ORF Transcript_15296/g.64538 Transcript_15296/m.64538 type:complete len:224 (-) Transcript_15296:2934-3605(-)